MRAAPRTSRCPPRTPTSCCAPRTARAAAPRPAYSSTPRSPSTAAQQAGLRFVGLARNTTADRQLREAGCATTVTSLAPLLRAARSL
ncbi:hypothetical protein [Streptomyces sp. NPDC058735]|uniref:hypothetical protein n=1 Tax=unclassified Streptomyces TaxID=2593676 RepID=UPI0036A7B479